MLIAAGPSRTMNKVGRMKTIIGTVSIAGRRAAFSSARVIRAARNSFARIRKRLGQRGAELRGLLQGADNCPDRVQIGAAVEVVERRAAVRQECQLGGGYGEFFGEFGPAGAELARHPYQGRVQTEPGLGANNHQVEPVWQRQLQSLVAFPGGVLQIDVGRVKSE